MVSLCTRWNTFCIASTFELAEREQELGSFLAERENISSYSHTLCASGGVKRAWCVSICIEPQAFKRSVCGPTSYLLCNCARGCFSPLSLYCPHHLCSCDAVIFWSSLSLPVLSVSSGVSSVASFSHLMRGLCLYS